MCVGRPVVITDVGDVGELVRSRGLFGLVAVGATAPMSAAEVLEPSCGSGTGRGNRAARPTMLAKNGA